MKRNPLNNRSPLITALLALPSALRRIDLSFLGVACLLSAIPAVLAWHIVRQQRLNSTLLTAVKRNDARAVVSLLNQGADANCRDAPPSELSFGQLVMDFLSGRPTQRSHAPTPLLIALKALPQPQPPNKLARQPYPVYSAVYPPENVPLVRALLDHGALVNERDYGMTPLYLAIGGGKNATIRLLLARGGIAACFPDDTPPLVLAAMNPTVEPGVIAELLEHGVKVNPFCFDSGQTPLNAAVLQSRVDVVRLLLAYHADVNVSNDLRATPLAMAIQQNTPQSRQIVRLLKAAGAKP